MDNVCKILGYVQPLYEWNSWYWCCREVWWTKMAQHEWRRVQWSRSTWLQSDTQVVTPWAVLCWWGRWQLIDERRQAYRRPKVPYRDWNRSLQKVFQYSEIRFTLIGLTALDGQPVTCILILKGNRKNLSIEPGIDITAIPDGQAKTAITRPSSSIILAQASISQAQQLIHSGGKKSQHWWGGTSPSASQAKAWFKGPFLQCINTPTDHWVTESHQNNLTDYGQNIINSWIPTLKKIKNQCTLCCLQKVLFNQGKFNHTKTCFNICWRNKWLENFLQNRQLWVNIKKIM